MRRDKTTEEQIQALHKNVKLLKLYHHHAFELGDADFLGEVAGKLRLLIYRSKTCHPLLLDLMEKLGISVRLGLTGPGGGSADVQEYFHNVCGVFPSDRTGNRVEVKRIDIVSRWANQIGAGHEDPAIDIEFEELLQHQFFVNQRQIAVDELRRSSSFVLKVYEYFVADYEKKGRAKPEA